MILTRRRRRERSIGKHYTSSFNIDTTTNTVPFTLPGVTPNLAQPNLAHPNLTQPNLTQPNLTQPNLT